MNKSVQERNSREIVKRLKNEGWILVNIEGRHHKFRHPLHMHSVIVPHPKKDLPKGTARSIARAAGWLGKST